jgi:ABC-2 type transport system permease protein
MMNLLRATGVVFARQMRPTLRSPFAIAVGMVQPLLYVLLFGPLLSGVEGASGPSAGATSWQWFVPGMLVSIALFSTAYSGADIQYERDNGVLDRMLVTPVSRVALVVGRVLRDVVILLAQAVVIVALVAPFGLRVSPAGASTGLLLLALLGAGIGIVSLALGLMIKQAYVFYNAMGTATLPLLLTSGVMLPMTMAPGWLHTLSRANPLSHVVDAERALFAGDLTHPAVPVGLLVALAGGTISAAVAMRAMRCASA